MTDLDKFLIARFLYSVGIDFISDAEYDSIRKTLEDQGQEFSPLYEKDLVPFDALRRSGFSEEDIKSFVDSTESTEDTDDDFLRESPCLSINSVNSFQEAFIWFREHKDQELILTPKIDGINTRRGFRFNADANQLVYAAALTRGRSGASLDITRNLRYITPRLESTQDVQSNLIIHSETFVPFKHIDYLCQNYGVKLTVPRGAGISMARTSQYSLEDYWMLRSPVFRVDYGETLTAGLDKAKDLGFDVVPYWRYTYTGEDYEVFQPKLEALMREIKDTADSLDYPTDGTVVQVNDMLNYVSSNASRGYSTANLALKTGLWQPGVYESVVRSVFVQQQDEQGCCVAIVDPVIAANGQTLQRVNLFNPDIMISRNILPGSRIKFEYKNETTINLIY